MQRRTFLKATVAAPVAWNARASTLPRVFRAGDSSPSERYAAEELALWLGRALGSPIAVVEVADGSDTPECSLFVGCCPLAQALFPQTDLQGLGPEEYVLIGQEQRMLLAGGQPRGTLYAVYHYLHEYLGVRWWTPWANDVPALMHFEVPRMDRRIKPSFDARDPYWHHTFDGEWAARNFSNSDAARLDDRHGGRLRYRGFVHTFYAIVPPDPHFAAHPEWFSLIDGERRSEKAQLCTTNPELRAFIIRRIRELLRQASPVDIVSVSQNDWGGPCQCDACHAIDAAEGSHSGSVLALVNHVAQVLGPEFPMVAFDTLAYQYTRRAPLTLRPEHNVIVRLCSIECNFRLPFTHPSNRAFHDDLEAWSRICPRLHVWDYTTNFAHFGLPHPNWYVLGENIRALGQMGVKGVFAQGAHLSMGAEMAELRAWVLAQLLRDSSQDDAALIRAFLDGYYGVEAAPYIRRYMDLLWEASEAQYLGCFNKHSTSNFLTFRILQQAEQLWRQAAWAVRNDATRQWRVRLGHQPVRYAFLAGWQRLREDCRSAGDSWPLSESVQEVADEWVAFVTTEGPPGWRPMQVVNEWGKTPQEAAVHFVQLALGGPS